VKIKIESWCPGDIHGVIVPEDEIGTFSPLYLFFLYFYDFKSQNGISIEKKRGCADAISFHEPKTFLRVPSTDL
jgi:hypothetical protein